MAVFVDLDEEAEPPNTDMGGNPHHCDYRAAVHHQPDKQLLPPHAEATGDDKDANVAGASEPSSARDHFRNGMTEALGCYPIAMAVTASLDLNTLHNLSRTCRAVRLGLLQYRSSLVTHTLHCVNEDVEVDPDDTFRYRARAGNWFYMRDDAQYNGKSGSCARDMVDGCRRCGNVVCRNCAIKPPAPIVLRDRHRRLCIACSKAPLGSLAKPPLLPDTPVDAGIMKRAMCTCESEGVWLCQPCGRSIRGADHDYQAIWRWRNQYGEILGGVGTGIGDGDRGVICGRDFECLAAKEREHETDCDAADAREFSHSNTPTPRAAAGASATSLPLSVAHAGTPASASSANLPLFPSTPPSAPAALSNPMADAASTAGRTPSPAHSLGPGYARHEIEGIGGVVKTKRLSMVKVGACVPEWEDEKNEGKILRREVQGAARSWCGWCWRVIPGKKDYEKTREMVIR